MRLGIIITQADPETVFNALRLANFSLQQGDQVSVFLSGRGVEIDRIEHAQFNVKEQARSFLDKGGAFLACGTCLKSRESQGSEICPLSTMKDQYELIRDSDKVVTF